MSRVVSSPRRHLWSGCQFSIGLALLSGCEGPLPAPFLEADSIAVLPIPQRDAVDPGEDVLIEALATAAGRPVGGVSVQFALTEGSGHIEPRQATTDATGRALVRWTAGVTSGPARITASALPAVGQWEGRVRSGPAAQLTLRSGVQPSDTVGALLPDSVEILVTDAFGNPVANALVSGLALDGGRVHPDTVRSGASGLLRFTWELGDYAGMQRMRATVHGADTLLLTAWARAATPTRVSVRSGAGQQSQVTTALPEPLIVRISDTHGNGVPQADLTIEDRGSGVRVSTRTDTLGDARIAWTLSSKAGPQVLIAFGPTTDTAVVQEHALAGPPVALALYGGDGQSGVAGAPLPLAPTVMASDAWGNPVEGAETEFVVTGGGGQIERSSAATGPNGRADAGRWTLGPSGPQTLRSRLAGNGLAVDFMANAVAGGGTGFSLEIEVVGAGLGSMEQAALAGARARWQGILAADLPDVSFLGGSALPPGACGVPHPTLERVVDDLLVLLEVGNIDGPGGAAANAGVCRIRAGTLLPAISVIRLDAADLSTVSGLGLLEDLLLHELGHALGVGLFWSAGGLLQGGGGPDPLYVGGGGSSAWAILGGMGFPPVENTGGPGVRDVHWRESVLGAELMTSVFAGGGNPLSLLTVQSLADLGYQVNGGSADPLSLSSPVTPVLAPFRDGVLLLLPLSVTPDGRAQGVPPNRKR